MASLLIRDLLYSGYYKTKGRDGYTAFDFMYEDFGLQPDNASLIGIRYARGYVEDYQPEWLYNGCKEKGDMLLAYFWVEVKTDKGYTATPVIICIPEEYTPINEVKVNVFMGKPYKGKETH